MKRCVIVGGADINNYEYISSHLHRDDYIVFCDSGLKHLGSAMKSCLAKKAKVTVKEGKLLLIKDFA